MEPDIDSKQDAVPDVTTKAWHAVLAWVVFGVVAYVLYESELTEDYKIGLGFIFLAIAWITTANWNENRSKPPTT